MTERSFEETPEFYKYILDALPLTVAVLNAEGEIVEANQQWDQFGVENDIDPAFLEEGVNYLDVCENAQGEFATKAYEGLKTIIGGDRSEFSLEYPCHGENEKRWFLMKARILGTESQEYLLVVHLDITQRVLSERELRHKEKLASIGEMSAGIMHEINNPNSFISGNVEYLLKRMGQLNNHGSADSINRDDFFQELEPILEDIKSGSDRIKRIVHKVEQFAQKQTTDEAETSLRILEATLESTLGQIRRTEDVEFIHLDNRLSDAAANQSVLLSPDEFQSILENLIMNAVTAVRRADPDNPEIHLQAVVEDTTLTLRVMDNGTGIDDEIKPKVRDPFFTTKSMSDGTGLGLSIVSNLTRKADGEFNLYSEPGEGTWAIVELPVTVSA